MQYSLATLIYVFTYQWTKDNEQGMLLTAKSYNEARTAANLENQGIEIYFPQITVEKSCKV